jgi:hypothetical protein
MIALLLGSLMGCSDDPEPSVLETPDIVWPDGMPTGPYDDTEWMEAIRATDVTMAVAWSTLDFSDRSLVELLGYHGAQEAARNTEESRRYYSLAEEEYRLRHPGLYGPWGRTVLDQFETSDSEVELVVCTDRPDQGNGFRTVETWTMTRDSDGIYHSKSTFDVPAAATKSYEDYRVECNAAEIRRGYFDPPFTPILDPEAPVIGPADESKYDLP